MKVEVLRKIGTTWVVVTYKNGQVVDWRPAPASIIVAAMKK